MIDTLAIMSQIDLETAIEYYTGNRFKHGKILCPFHNDKHPSLTIKNGRFRCWACDASGSVIDFTMRLFDLNFIDAVRKLSSDFNVNVSGLGYTQEEQRPDLWDDLTLKIEAERKAEITQMIIELTEEINLLTDKHRALFQAGENEAADLVIEQIEQANDKIEFLQNCLRGVIT